MFGDFLLRKKDTVSLTASVAVGRMGHEARNVDNCEACAPHGRMQIMLPCGSVKLLGHFRCPNRPDCSFPLASTVGWDVWTRVLILDFLVDLYKTGTTVFFSIDASVFPLSTSWFSGTSVVKDPLPVDEAVDLPCVELLNENRTIIRMYSEIFLCLVGLSHSFTKTEYPHVLLLMMRVEMGLLDFVNSMDPFKVKTGERTLAENEVPFLTETRDRVISPSPQPISLVDHTIRDELNVNVGKRKKIVAFVFGSPPVKKAQTEGVIISDSWPSTAGKSPTAMRRHIRKSGQANTGYGSAAPITEDATFSSVTHTPKHASEDDNVRTHPPSDRFVVLSLGSADTGSPTSPQVVPPVSSAQVVVSVPVTELVSDGRTSSAPELEARTLSCGKLEGGVE
ncbi:hypothetical protein Tco_1492690 [Tanacetum coccineum]